MTSISGRVNRKHRNLEFTEQKNKKTTHPTRPSQSPPLTLFPRPILPVRLHPLPLQRRAHRKCIFVFEQAIFIQDLLGTRKRVNLLHLRDLGVDHLAQVVNVEDDIVCRCHCCRNTLRRAEDDFHGQGKCWFGPFGTGSTTPVKHSVGVLVTGRGGRHPWWPKSGVYILLSFCRDRRLSTTDFTVVVASRLASMAASVEVSGSGSACEPMSAVALTSVDLGMITGFVWRSVPNSHFISSGIWSCRSSLNPASATMLGKSSVPIYRYPCDSLFDLIAHSPEQHMHSAPRVNIIHQRRRNTVRDGHAADAVRAQSLLHEPAQQRVVNGHGHDQPLCNRVLFVPQVIGFAEVVGMETGFPLVEGCGGNATEKDWLFWVACAGVPEIGGC